VQKIAVVSAGLALLAGILVPFAAAKAAERNFAVGGFDRVSVGGSTDVSVTTGKAVGVRATGDADAIDRIEIMAEKNSLRIGTKRGSWGWKSGQAHLYVTVPALNGVAVAGSADVDVDRVEAGDFSASISGSGNVKIASLTAGTANFETAGSGNAMALGNVGGLSVKVSGSGSADLAGLKAINLTAAVIGSGNLDAYATGAATLSVAGSGNIKVAGGAPCTTSRAGSGAVRCG
jgi:hypothetical protein